MHECNVYSKRGEGGREAWKKALPIIYPGPRPPPPPYDPPLFLVAVLHDQSTRRFFSGSRPRIALVPCSLFRGISQVLWRP